MSDVPTSDAPVDPPRPGLAASLAPLLTLIVLLALNVYLFGDDALSGPHQIALLVSGGLTAALAARNGVGWSDIQQRIVASIGIAVPAILILLMVGALSGTWLVSGIVPAMIYYGLHILNPAIFLLAACIIGAVISLATGSSWTTSATVGIALMGIGRALGIHEGMIAGAVLSGAYFGDKLSPLSDTTNLAAGVGGTDLFTHIRYLVYTTGPSIGIALLGYLGLGLVAGAGGGQVDNQALYDALNARFDISLWLMLVPALVIYMIVRRVPALPAIFIGALLGAVAALIAQPEVVLLTAPVEGNAAPYTGIMSAMFGQVAIATGHPVLDELLRSKGMAGMLPTIWLILSAMVFGGTMEAGGFLTRITQALLGRVRSDGSLIAATAGTCLTANATASDQYLAIVVPGRMFANAFRERGLAPQNLTRTLEDAGTVTSVLIPWNTCGAFHAGVLGVATFSYAPFAFFCLLSPFMTLLFGYRGIRLARAGPELREDSTH